MPLFFIAGAVSQYVGAAIGVYLFETTEPATVAWFRAAGAAVLLLAWRRPWRNPWTLRSAAAATAFTLVTVAMNVAFYEAIARIPLGTAVAIEFAGPVAVATLGARRARDLVGVALVAAGVFLLTGVEADVDGAGVGFALIAAGLWAGYILLGKRVADAGSGLDSLAMGMTLAAVVLAPALLGLQFATDASVFVDPRTWLYGAGVGVLSSAIPYALDQRVLAVVGRERFALLLALLPATAAVVGALMLAQQPTVNEIIGIALVMLALVATATTAARPSGKPPEPPGPI
ncbi:EamA family transporter [Mycobacterium sp. ITM-2017-0098]|nr:EamA family transporter [Mycobacterium sp. ITM-2017-0098]